MNVTLHLAGPKDAARIFEMQRKAFAPLLARYHDDETSPAAEPLQKTVDRLLDPSTDFYLICAEEIPVGAARVLRVNETVCRLGPLFVLPAFQGRGVAQVALPQLEALYPRARLWRLDTLLEEKGNCHLYEKAGYRQTGSCRKVNDLLTLVDYEKHL